MLGKPTAERLEVNSLQDILDEIMPIIYSEGNLYNVEVNVEILVNPLKVNCTKDHIKQVILNVAKTRWNPCRKAAVHLFRSPRS